MLHNRFRCLDIIRQVRLALESQLLRTHINRPFQIAAKGETKLDVL